MSAGDDEFARLRAACAAAGPDAMLESLATSLRARRRWHALVDVRLLQARLALGLPPTGDSGPLAAGDRDRLDELSLAACREAGWPLLEEGQVAAAWMYLRAAAEPPAVAARLARLADEAFGDAATSAGGDDEDRERLLHEIMGVALWEGVDPALGIELVLKTQGTCPAITAYDQAVARLPAARQRPAAARLVAHLHAELTAAVAGDLEGRGIATGSADETLGRLLEAAGGLGDASIHCDVSHLHAVLRIARVCDDAPTLTRAWELARYACRLPAEVTYPGAAPFTDVGPASRLFYGAHLRHDVDEAVSFFRQAAVDAARDGAGPLPAETLALLLWRLGRPGDALRAALDRPSGEPPGAESLPPGALPSLVELAVAAGDFEPLRAACRDRGDEITFAATLAAEAHQARGRPPRGPQAAHSAQGPLR
ncbi:MAG: hypothetical protein ACKOZU_03635 [Planctomycetaceae bacterium]